jgi:hypothetical protein
LVVTLQMIVLDELGDREAEVALAEGNQLAEALGLDGQHEALRERVEVGAAGREPKALDASGTEDR